MNFWLYDEEEFEFVDGKLLLRGQNASGKSITTQSFVPFILDGDRTPSRLDPLDVYKRQVFHYPPHVPRYISTISVHYKNLRFLS